MPAEGNLVLVRLRPADGPALLWPDTERMVTAAYVRAGVYRHASNGSTISGVHVIWGWIPMADAVQALDGRSVSVVPDMPNIPPPPPRKIGTGAEALAREEAAQDPDEPCRVRRVFDGKYLEWDDTGAAAAMYNFVSASVFPRVRAAAIANAMIVLTGEHDIEVEPVNG
jgi:hypothetical protein